MLLFLINVALQMLEANSKKGGVELLEIRPEQLTSQDLRGEQVPLSMMITPCSRTFNLFDDLKTEQEDENSFVCFFYQK